MATVIEQVKSEECTGCGACMNACPVNAIKMVENEEGFIEPYIEKEKCINCGKCNKCCPVLNNHKVNVEPDSVAYAIRCRDELREKSSSGGVFSLLAEYIIRKKGYVIGAVFDEKFEVYHEMINSLNGLDKMRGSKYVQSNVGYIYREVEKVLKQDKYVLFSGCPCQVAALKKYLDKEYERLFVVDIVCHGVPSQHIFTRYLNELANGRKVKSVKFRDKRYGWISTRIYVEFENGEVYEGDWRNDAYEIGFQKNIFLRKSCSDCSFCDFPREGDISMGDFWQVEKIDPLYNDGKGTSLVFFNNEKGLRLFEQAKEKSTLVNKVDIPYRKIANRLMSKYPSHVARDRFFDLIKNHKMNEAVNMINKNLYDIGVVGIHTVENFGGALTYYALYCALKEMGYSVLMIERPLNANHKPKVGGAYKNSPYKDYEVAPFYKDKQEMEQLNAQCSSFIVGSDQLFNDYLYHNFGKWCTLDWVRDNKKKIAYAASFGHDYIWSSEETRAEMSYFMKKFDFFSVREDSGIKIAKEEFGIDATWVLDPVFLCERDRYDNLIKQEEICKKRYIGAYILDPTFEKQKILEKVARRLKQKLEIYSEMNYRSPNNGWSLEVKKGEIEDRLCNIKYSDFYIADSFHGVCFAIIYNKPFIAICNEKRGKSRLESILKLLGLEKRMIYSVDEVDKILNQEIDYYEVNRLLEKEKKRCKEWLKNSLVMEKKKAYSTYDILEQKIQQLLKCVNSLQKENQMLTEKVKILQNNFKEEFASIHDISKYFNKIQENIEKLIVIIAVRDTPGHFFREQTYELMKMIGLKVCLVDKHWYAYVGISDGGNVVEEVLNKEGKAYLNKEIESLHILIKSMAYKNGDCAHIVLNEKEWAVNKRGINVVLIEKDNLVPIDSVCFDTHTPQNMCYR